MEVLARRRRVGNRHVAFGAQLEEPLQARARVLRALPFVAVREQHHHRGILRPLRAIGRDELVDHGLRDVDEITELGFPQHERIIGGGAVPVLEAEHAGLGQRAVVDLERALGVR